MSGAILYLAIVVLWAVILVPRWLHRAHTSHRPGAGLTGPEMPADRARPADAGVPARDEEVASDVGLRESEGEDGRVPPGWSGGGEVARPLVTAERARVLRARRRMLLTLMAIMAGAVAVVTLHLAATWVLLPPAVMLAGFLLLLREAARSDARQAREASAWAAARREYRAGQRRAATAAQAGMAEAGTTDTAPPLAGHGAVQSHGEPHGAATAGPPEPAPAPDAEVIELSARIADQLYDQYSDATERAVGD